MILFGRALDGLFLLTLLGCYAAHRENVMGGSTLVPRDLVVLDEDGKENSSPRVLTPSSIMSKAILASCPQNRNIEAEGRERASELGLLDGWWYLYSINDIVRAVIRRYLWG